MVVAMNFLRFQNPAKPSGWAAWRARQKAKAEAQARRDQDETSAPTGPEGHCFRNVTMYAAKIGGEVVHGTVKFVTGRRGDHAWIEKRNQVIDPTIGLVTTKEHYYDMLEAVPEARYSEVEAIRNMMRCSHHGPWHK